MFIGIDIFSNLFYTRIFFSVKFRTKINYSFYGGFTGITQHNYWFKNSRPLSVINCEFHGGSKITFTSISKSGKLCSMALITPLEIDSPMGQNCVVSVMEP